MEFDRVFLTPELLTNEKFKIRMSSMNKSVLYTLRYLVQNGNSTFLAT